MKRIVLIITAFIMFFIESVILTRLQVFHVTIPLTFIYGLVVSIYEDKWEGFILALVTGFLFDLYTPHLFGINMLLNLWTFALASKLSSYLRKENKILMYVFMALLTLVKLSIELLIVRLLKGNAHVLSVGKASLLVLIFSYPVILIYKRIVNSRYLRRLI